MEAIDMTKVKAALSNLPGDRQEVERLYCAELARRLNDELLPMGISMAFMLLDYDLQKGVSGFASMPLPQKLVGYPTQVYALLHLSAALVVVDNVPKEHRAAVETALAV